MKNDTAIKPDLNNTAEINLDDPAIWLKAVLEAARLGAFHSSLGEKASSAKQLMARLVPYFCGLRIRYRRFHLDELRRAYGAAYVGIVKTREAKARGL